MARRHTSDSALGDLVVDRVSPVPMYFQVASHIEGRIVSGVLPTGAILQNELDLAASLGLSRPTMRRAMQLLVEKGLVVRRRGVGTRVIQPKLQRPLELSSLHDDLGRAGRTPTTEVLAFTEVAATEEIATALEVDLGAPVREIVRLRSADGEPIAKMTNYLPPGRLELTADDLAGSGLYELMRRRGVVLHSAHQTLGARNATAAEARLLGEPRGAALVTATRVTIDDHGTPVEYGTHVYAASRYTFTLQLLA